MIIKIMNVKQKVIFYKINKLDYDHPDTIR